MTTRPFRLGILFVHGIGLQPQGDTLVRWSDALIDTIERATSRQVVVTADRAKVSEPTADATAELSLWHENQPERWLLREGWWAESFPAPSYPELVSWSVRALPWSLAIYVAQRYWRNASVSWTRANLWPLAKAFATLVAALALTPIVLVFLTVSLLLGALPVPQIRTWILGIQSILTATIGDSLAFVESPLRGGLIRTRILDAFSRMEVLCDRTVVLAHSQGAAAALDALGCIVPADGKARRFSPVMPNALVTFGAGTNQLVSNMVLSKKLLSKISHNPASSGTWAVIALIALTAWLYADIRSASTTLPTIGKALGLWLGTISVISAIAGSAIWAVQKAAHRWDIMKRNEQTAIISILGAILLGLLLPALWYLNHMNLPLGAISVLTVAVMLVFGSTAMLLSQDLKSDLAIVRRPDGLEAWTDIYASNDPVPNGPTLMEDPGRPKSIEIWNLGSAFGDHTGYWDNRDGFVLRIARECGRVAESPWLAQLPTETQYVDRRAAWRIGFLRLARRTVFLSVMLAGVVALGRYSRSPIVPIPVPDWVPAGVTAVGLVLAIIAVVAWACGRLVTWVWSRWTVVEQDAFLRNEPPEGSPWDRLTLTAFPVWLVVIGAYAMVNDRVTVPSRDDLLSASAVALGWSLITAWGYSKLCPPPGNAHESVQGTHQDEHVLRT